MEQVYMGGAVTTLGKVVKMYDSIAKHSKEGCQSISQVAKGATVIISSCCNI